MKLRTRLWVAIFAIVSFCASAQASTTDDILNVIDSAHVESSGGVKKLYGVTVNGEDLNGGRWACARVVGIILNKAGVGISRKITAVAEVQSALSDWEKIDNYNLVRAGDVIVYKHKNNELGKCTGSGNCHVVIAVSTSRVYGNVGRSIPGILSQGPQTHFMAWLRPAGFVFKRAYRPPN